jgi:hypothetical protein
MLHRVYISFLVAVVAFVLLKDGAVCQGKAPKFYIYDWPTYIDDVWPPAGGELHNRSAYSHDFRGNNGAGRVLDGDIGLFQTWQFSLYRNAMARLRTSEHRTLDPREATSFVIPFDLGVHSYIDHNNGFPRLASPHGWMAQALLRDAAKDKDLFWKNQGHDHFVFLSITAYQMVGIGVKTFFMQICQNCTTISIETSPTFTAIKGRTRKYWYGAPYPSSFHWHEKIKTLPWEPKSERELAQSKSGKERPLLALFIGSLRTSQPNSNTLRRYLYNQCQDDAECEWHTTRHACTGVLNATTIMLRLRDSVFCPAPTGDSITRKSIFDSLVAGCIPVLFSRASLSQYSWHFTPEQMEKVSVYIPMSAINVDNVNFLEVLRKVSPEEVAEKQQLIREIAPSLQYSIVPENIGNGSDGRTWKPPFKDAQEVIIQKILDRNTVEPIQGFSDEQILEMLEKQNYIMSTSEDYAALRRDRPGQKPKYKRKREIAPGLKGVSKIIPT